MRAYITQYTHTHRAAFVRDDDSGADQFEVVAAALSHTPQTAIESYTHPGSSIKKVNLVHLITTRCGDTLAHTSLNLLTTVIIYNCTY